MRHRSGMRLTCTFGAGLLLLGMCWLVTGVAWERVHGNLYNMAAVDTSLSSQVQAISTAMIDQETSLQRYLLTRNRGFLRPYDAANQALPPVMAAAQQLVHGSLDTAYLQEMNQRARSWQQWATTQLNNGRPGQQALVVDGEIRFDRFRSATTRLLHQLQNEHQQRLDASRQTLDVTLIVLSAIVLAVMAVVALLGLHSRKLLMQEKRARASATAAERALEESVDRYRSLVYTSPDSIVLADLTGTILMANQCTADLHGYARDEAMIGLNLLDLVAPHDASRAAEELCVPQDHRQPSESSMEYTLLKSDGTPFPAEVRSSVLSDSTGNPLAVTIVARDISERKTFEEQLKHQALHDALTKLPNRILLHERLQQSILTARRYEQNFALLLMDLDRFKDINDTFGHHCGDLLLQQMGPSLEGILRESDTIARLGGDEFAVLLPDTDVDGAVVAAEKILGALDQPFVLQEQSFSIGASIGITIYPEHGKDAATLLQRADVAMYSAKRADSGYATYFADADQHSPDRLALVGELRKAIDQDQLLLYFQPKVDLKTGAVDGVEALVRWQHPERGLLLPDVFIPLAEHTGLIQPLTIRVLDLALQQCRAWHARGMPIRVAVNLSARSLRDPQLGMTIAQLLQTWQVEPRWLEVELTESAIMDDPFRAIEILSVLHGMGVQISIDDFGTGYSSLAYLKRLPVDQIKIDRSFVMDMASSDNDCSIIRATISLGHDLGLRTVAEGVETQSVWDLLKQLDCDLVQGNFLGGAMPVEECTRWLSRWSWRAAS